MRHGSAASSAALAIIAFTTLTGCSAPSTSDAADMAPPSSEADAFPLTVENCGSEVTLTRAPRRIVLVNNDALPNLEALGAVDRVVAITSTPEPGLYDPATYTTLSDLGVLSTEKNATGGSVVSQESILGAEPDLVIAPERSVDRNALASAGIPLFTPTAYCAKPGNALSEQATFDRVWNEIRTLGDILGEANTATEVVAKGRAVVENSVPATGTAVALYVSSGGSVLSPYGGPSMVTPIFEAAGLRNVYADTKERVFDANIEDIISREPDNVVLLYSSGNPQDTIASFLSSPGVSGLSAVRSGHVVALQFPYTDPPTLLSLQGPERLTRLLAELP